MIFLVSVIYMLGQLVFNGFDYFDLLSKKVDFTTLSLLFLIAVGDIVVNLLLFRTF
jgi:hypothetical protein